MTITENDAREFRAERWFSLPSMRPVPRDGWRAAYHALRWERPPGAEYTLTPSLVIQISPSHRSAVPMEGARWNHWSLVRWRRAGWWARLWRRVRAPARAR